VGRTLLTFIAVVLTSFQSMRVVRISIDVQEEINPGGISWAAPYPSYTPTLLPDDVTALHALQRASFAPASTHSHDSRNGRLAAIKVYSPLGWRAGITGVVFAYDTGVESVWRSVDDAASLAFFIGEKEQLVKVIVYRYGSLVCHMLVSDGL